MRAWMSLTTKGRVSGGAGGFPKRNEVCKDVHAFSFSFCKLFCVANLSWPTWWHRIMSKAYMKQTSWNLKKHTLNSDQEIVYFEHTCNDFHWIIHTYIYIYSTVLHKLKLQFPHLLEIYKKTKTQLAWVGFWSWGSNEQCRLLMLFHTIMHRLMSLIVRQLKAGMDS